MPDHKSIRSIFHLHHKHENHNNHDADASGSKHPHSDKRPLSPSREGRYSTDPNIPQVADQVRPPRIANRSPLPRDPAEALEKEINALRTKVHVLERRLAAANEKIEKEASKNRARKQTLLEACGGLRRLHAYGEMDDRARAEIERIGRLIESIVDSFI